MDYKEIYCHTCKKILGRYNEKYFSDMKIAEIIRSNHALHIREGHQIVVRRIEKDS